MSHSSESLTRRAILALLLTIGFYGLALISAGLLLAVPFLVFTSRYAFISIFSIMGAITALIAGLSILWSILPRWSRFVPPGPRLSAAEHPRLFAEIQAVADQVGQKLPEAVYLTPDVNAAVTERGGLLGIGRQRLMMLGIGLMPLLTVAELQAVVAHEFGHYHHGDTLLGPWIWRTRAALERTITNLSGGSFLQRLFFAYWEMFMRLTQSVARQQEFDADALSARVAGRDAAMSALTKLSGGEPAFTGYWYAEYLPALLQGYRPPLMAGFQRYLGESHITSAVERSSQHALARQDKHEYDSHPTLHERIAALQARPAGPADDDPAPALSLFGDCDAAERQLVADILKGKATSPLQSVAWDDVGSAVWVPMWEARAREFAPAVVGVTPESLPEYLRQPDALNRAIKRGTARELGAGEVREEVALIVGGAVAVLLARRGWRVDAPPGGDVIVSRDGQTVQPFAEIRDLMNIRPDVERWCALCASLGIQGADLGQLPTPTAPELAVEGQLGVDAVAGDGVVQDVAQP